MEENTTDTEPTKPESKATEIVASISERIKNSNPTVIQTVIDKLADKEISRRADALTKAIEEGIKTDKEIAKLKGDVVTFDSEGKELTRSWSAAKIEEKKKLAKKADKINKAIEAALAQNSDYSQLFNLNSGDGDK